MSREVHVRFCESRGVRFPPATRLDNPNSDTSAGIPSRLFRRVVGRGPAGFGSERRLAIRPQMGVFLPKILVEIHYLYSNHLHRRPLLYEAPSDRRSHDRQSCPRVGGGSLTRRPRGRGFAAAVPCPCRSCIPRPQRPGDLAAALGVDPSTATRLCDRLVRKRLISRRRAGSDRREVRLDLTRTGNRLVDSVTQRRREEIEQLLRAVPTSERGNLVRAFEAFGRAAGEVPDGEWQRSWDL